MESALGEKQALPERKLRGIEAFLERYPEVQRVMIDGTERPIQRPQEPEQQKMNYSGKKRRHTHKHLAAMAQSKRVLVLSKAREGKLLEHSLSFRKMTLRAVFLMTYRLRWTWDFGVAQ